MSNNIFQALRRKMTLAYAAVCGTACLLIVALTCGLVWLGVMGLEKETLQETAAWAAAEYLESRGETAAAGSHGGMGSHMMGGHMMGRSRSPLPAAPHHPAPSADKNILRVLVTADRAECLDTARAAEAAPLLQLQSHWPQAPGQIAALTAADEAGLPLHYLAAAVQLAPGSLLYVFKDISGYYALAASLLPLLAGLLLVLCGGAVLLSWWLAGRNLHPVEQMYLRQQQFTSDASHELRTPLHVLRLAVHALREDAGSCFSPFARKNFAILDEESARLEQLTEELLLLSRSDSGRLAAKQEAVDFSAVAAGVLEKMNLPAAEKNIFIRSRIEQKITLQGHEDSLQRLLVILLDNAVKYSPADSDIDFSLTAEGGTALLRVADCGPGISDADKPHVTDRFYRGDKSRTRGAGGTGLGLALAAAIIREHHGRLHIRDNVPRGTSMEISLPL